LTVFKILLGSGSRLSATEHVYCSYKSSGRLILVFSSSDSLMEVRLSWMISWFLLWKWKYLYHSWFILKYVNHRKNLFCSSCDIFNIVALSRWSR